MTAGIEDKSCGNFDLHIIPPKIPGESQTEYIWRVAEENGFEAKRFATILVPERWKAGYGRDAKLSPELQYLRNQVLGPDGETAIKMDHRKQRVICPKCLHNDQGVLMAFQCHAYHYCAEHRCKLIRECPQCDAQLNWFVGDRMKCQCGYPVAHASPEPATKLEFELFSAVLENRDFRFDYELRQSTPKNPIELDDVLITCDRLADSYQQLTFVPINNDNSAGLHSPIASPKVSWHDRAESLIPWPSSFLRAAAHLNARHGITAATGYKFSKWKPLSNAQRILSSPANESIAIFGDVPHNANWHIVRSWHSPGNSTGKSREGSLFINDQDWVDYKSSGLVPPICQRRRAAPAFLERDVIEYFCGRYPDSVIRLETLSRFLRHVAIEATAYGKLCPVVPVDLRSWRFDKQEIQALRVAVADIVERMKCVGTSKFPRSFLDRHRHLPFTHVVMDKLLQSMKFDEDFAPRSGALESKPHLNPGSPEYAVQKAWRIHQQMLQRFQPQSRWQQDAAIIARAHLGWPTDLIKAEHVGKVPKVRYLNDVISPDPKTYS